MKLMTDVEDNDVHVFDLLDWVNWWQTLFWEEMDGCLNGHLSALNDGT
jgi:hypothetical protein